MYVSACKETRHGRDEAFVAREIHRSHVGAQSRRTAGKNCDCGKAVTQRIEELGHGNNDSQEDLWALNDALRGLRVLAKFKRTLDSPKLDIRQRQEAT